MACKDHLTFGAFVGHACIAVLVGNNACVDYLRKTIALLCRKFIELSQSIFIREIFALNSLLFNRRSNAPVEEEGWNVKLSALCSARPAGWYKTTFSSQAATWLTCS